MWNQSIEEKDKEEVEEEEDYQNKTVRKRNVC